MADETKSEPVTDSRFTGFNPEVEASHAAAEKAAAEAAAAAQAAAPTAPLPPVHTHRCGMCGAMYEQAIERCPACGSASAIETVSQTPGA